MYHLMVDLVLAHCLICSFVKRAGAESVFLVFLLQDGKVWGSRDSQWNGFGSPFACVCLISFECRNPSVSINLRSTI